MQHPESHSGHLGSKNQLVLRRSRTSAVSADLLHCPATAPAPSCLQSLVQHASSFSACSFLRIAKFFFFFPFPFFAVVSFRKAPTAAYIPAPPPLLLLMREHCQTRCRPIWKRNVFSSCANTAKIFLVVINEVFPLTRLLKKSNPTTTGTVKGH